jgi:magnesium-transporting ATPase (P-type)
VTGNKAYQFKQVIEHIKATSYNKELKEDNQSITPSNILYSGSHIVEGHGLAIACAVGCRTQKGMAEGSF